ncbi:hypothetical protein GKE82_23560 [Conexibacter sp. W3-3-2]|uniref:hypothetical protein n=1 Tax=Conexibacter sp. W3-3-2 TaxID=2675227 RepID=UPI0012B8E359|nr:hypothetical protein [Conexibacter sp. W3-3-2]MTD47183.1 hypothetical protein [Conexibacter sp. W3-3-2]
MTTTRPDPNPAPTAPATIPDPIVLAFGRFVAAAVRHVDRPDLPQDVNLVAAPNRRTGQTDYLIVIDGHPDPIPFARLLRKADLEDYDTAQLPSLTPASP